MQSLNSSFIEIDDETKTSPFIAIIAPQGKAYWKRILSDWIKNKEQPTLIIVENTSVKKSLLFHLKNTYKDKKKLFQVVEEDTLQEDILISFQEDNKEEEVPSKIFGIYDKILYFLPNRERPTILTTSNARLLELAHKDFDSEVVPQTIYYGVNTQSIPALQIELIIFDKHESDFFDNVVFNASNEEYILDSGDIYEEMARKILRLHMQFIGRKIVCIVASASEIKQLMNLLRLGEMDKLKIIDVSHLHKKDINEKNMMKEDEEDVYTIVYVTDESHMFLVEDSIDIVVDCGIGMRLQASEAMGGNTLVRSKLPKDEILSHASILQTSTNLQTFGEIFVMQTKEELAQPRIFKENVHYFILKIGTINIDPVEILEPTKRIHKALLELESIGAINTDYKTTQELGNFMLSLLNDKSTKSLSPFELTVIWIYLHQEWSKKAISMWAVMWMASIVSLFNTSQPYFMLPSLNPSSNLNSIQQDDKFKKMKYNDIIGKDDVATYLNIWKHIHQSLRGELEDYYAWKRWGESNGLNGDLFRQAFELAKNLIQKVRKWGFVNDSYGNSKPLAEDDNRSIDVVKDGDALRRVYSQVYILNRLVRLQQVRGVQYKSYSTQSIYIPTTLYAINTIQRTTPNQVVCPILSDDRMLITILNK
jgi:hypothetical protein